MTPASLKARGIMSVDNPLAHRPSPLWPWLAVCAPLAVGIYLVQFHQCHHSDSLIPKILSRKTTFALALLVGIAFWAVDVSQSQLFRNPFPPMIPSSTRTPTLLRIWYGR